MFPIVVMTALHPPQSAQGDRSVAWYSCSRPLAANGRGAMGFPLLARRQKSQRRCERQQPDDDWRGARSRGGGRKGYQEGAVFAHPCVPWPGRCGSGSGGGGDAVRCFLCVLLVVVVIQFSLG